MSAGRKIDIVKDCKKLFSPKVNVPEMVEVPKWLYLMVDGRGDPNTAEEFQQKIQALYGLAYTIKFMLKRDPKDPRDFVVAPLSGLWCADDNAAFSEGRKSEWKWTLMILMPDIVGQKELAEAKRTAGRKKPNAFYEDVRLEPYAEGPCAQIMHVGPFSQEKPTIAKLHDFIAEAGYMLAGLHHEIYLSDFRRTPQEKLRTIIRQPIRREGK